MADQQIRTTSGTLIGTIKTESNGKLKAVSPSGTILGYYDPKTNRTTLPSGTTVAQGNVLATLFK